MQGLLKRYARFPHYFSGRKSAHMVVAAGLAILVVFPLLLSAFQKPPAVGR